MAVARTRSVQRRRVPQEPAAPVCAVPPAGAARGVAAHDRAVLDGRRVVARQHARSVVVVVLDVLRARRAARQRKAAQRRVRLKEHAPHLARAVDDRLRRRTFGDERHVLRHDGARAQGGRAVALHGRRLDHVPLRVCAGQHVPR